MSRDDPLGTPPGGSLIVPAAHFWGATWAPVGVGVGDGYIRYERSGPGNPTRVECSPTGRVTVLEPPECVACQRGDGQAAAPPTQGGEALVAVSPDEAAPMPFTVMLERLEEPDDEA